MQTKILGQNEGREERRISPLLVLSFFVLSCFISFFLTGCGGGGSGSSSASDGPIDPALFSGWEMTNGPFSGMVSSFAVCPSDSQEVYAAVGNGGLFRSEDGGQNWTNAQEALENLSILDVAVAGDSKTIYVGTKGDGIYKTADKGGSWSPVNTGLPNRFFEVDDLVIDPDNNAIVFAILDTRYYLYKTNNGGNSWIEIGGGLPLDQIRSFAIHPVDTQSLYAGTYKNGIYKSENGGIWFDPINGDFPPNIVHISCIGIDPGDPIDPEDDIIYAGSHDYGLYKTEDDGNTWEFIPIADLTVLYNFHIDALAMDPVNKSVIYAYVEEVTLNDVPHPTKEGIYRSFNGGIDWEKVPFHEYPNTYRPVRDIVIAPSDGNVVYVTTQGEGLFMTNDVLNVVTVDDWEPIDNGLVDLSADSMILNPLDKKVVFAGTSRGVFKTNDGGLTWERKGLKDMSVLALANDPMNMNIMYAATDAGVYRTMNGGDSWSGPSVYQFNTLAIGKISPDRNVIFGGNAFGMGVYRAEDDVSTPPPPTPWEINWEQKNTGLSEDEKCVRCLAIDSLNPSILYAGTGYRRMPGPETAGKVIKTLDGGDTWPQKWSINEPVYSLSIDRYNPQILYAGTYVGVYASSDGGDTWVFMDGGLGQTYVRSIAIDPMDSEKVCAGTYEDGAFASIDGGENWTQIDRGLTCDLKRCIISLVMDLRNPYDPVVYAGTGCGVFRAYK